MPERGKIIIGETFWSLQEEVGSRAYAEGLLKEEVRTVDYLPWKEQGVEESRCREFRRYGDKI